MRAEVDFSELCLAGQVEECLERAFRLPGTAVDIFAAAAQLAESAPFCLAPARLSR